MSDYNYVSLISLLLLLVAAVATDIRSHRIPNILIVCGLLFSVAIQFFYQGGAGIGDWVSGLLIGFGLFFPFYVLGGMAAGDVKLMAMACCFFTPTHAVWMVFFSLMAGFLCGLLWILVRGQLQMTMSRYWLMLATRSHITPASCEVAAKPFPYSIAIFLGVIAALVWRPFDPWQILRYSFG